MKLALAFAAAAAIAAATPALAADAPSGINWYGNLGYSAYAFSDGTLNAVTARVGGRGAHFGIEGEVTGGLGDTSIEGVNVRLQDQYAGYVVGYLPIEHGDVFARVGLGEVDMHASCCLTFKNSSTTNVGVGGQWFFNGGNGVRLDYTYVNVNSGGGHINNYGISFVRKF